MEKAEKIMAEIERKLKREEARRRVEEARPIGKRFLSFRLRGDLYSRFQKLAKEDSLTVTECFEKFMNHCIQIGRIKTALKYLETSSRGQRLAYELQLKEALSDLEAYMRDDRENIEKGKRAFYEGNLNYVESAVYRVYELLPKIEDEKLLKAAENIVLAAVKFYNEELPKLKEKSAKAEN